MEEYGIRFEDAKKLRGYEFTKYMEIAELKEKLITGNPPYVFYVAVDLKFGFSRIDLMLVRSGYGYKLKYDISFMDYEGWTIYSYTYQNVDLEVIDIEKEMFGKLLKCAKKHQLNWDEPNEELQNLGGNE